MTHDHLSKEGTIFSGLGLPTSIITQENALEICLQANWWKYFPEYLTTVKSQKIMWKGPQSINQSIKPSSEAWQNTDCGLHPAQPCSSKEDVRKHHHTCLFSLSIAALARQMEEWGDAIKSLWLTSWKYLVTRPLRFTEPPLSQGFCIWKPFLPEKFYATLDKIKYLPTIIEQFTLKKKKPALWHACYFIIC